MRQIWPLLVMLGLCGALARGQGVPATGAVQGHVLYADTQQPARLAHVVLQPIIDLKSPALNKLEGAYRPEGTFHLQTVGLDGSFVVPAVPPGLYYVIAEQDGYISPLSLFTRAELNQPDEAMLRKIARYMTSVSVTAGHTTQAEVRLLRGATIAGKVSFEDGSPAVGVGMVLLQRDAKGKWTEARTSKLASQTSGHTDELGSYRFSGLAGGEYLVRASVELNNVVLDHIFTSFGSIASNDGYHLRIFPGDTFRTKDAKPVKVEEGEVAAAVDVDVPVSKLYALTGTVLHPSGAGPVNAAHVTLSFMDTGDELASTEVSSDDGSFRFDFVPGGSYTLQVTHAQDVQRTEVPTCKDCMPPTRTETKIMAGFGDVSQPLQLFGDQSGLMVHVKPAGKTVATASQ